LVPSNLSHLLNKILGTTEDVTWSNIKIYNTVFAIELNMNYSKPDPNDSTLPIIKNLIINNVIGQNITFVYNIQGLPQSPLQNVFDPAKVKLLIFKE
jgi:hypothetical protein